LLTSDIIIYAIGAGIQSNLNEDYNLIYTLNVTVPVAICNKLKELDYEGRFVTFGSVFEMGETCDERYFTEEDILSSICVAPNDYTVSKRMLSSFVASYKHNFTHWHFYIPTIYGEGENPKRLIPYTIYSIRNGEKLSFTAGDQTRQYIYVSEVSRVIGLAVEKNLPSGVYNIEGKETVTVREIVSKIHRSMGKKIPSDCFGGIQRNDATMKYLALDGKKLREAIGFEANISIVDVIDKY
jgi:nucleoside-diphosphate-sugar epimerase